MIQVYTAGRPKTKRPLNLKERNESKNDVRGVLAYLESRGMKNLKVVPLPGVDVTVRLPPCLSTISLEIDRPRPVPFPRSLVVKKA